MKRRALEGSIFSEVVIEYLKGNCSNTRKTVQKHIRQNHRICGDERYERSPTNRVKHTNVDTLKVTGINVMYLYNVYQGHLLTEVPTRD